MPVGPFQGAQRRAQNTSPPRSYLEMDRRFAGPASFSRLSAPVSPPSLLRLLAFDFELKSASLLHQRRRDAPSKDWKFGAPAILAGRSTRGLHLRRPASGASEDVYHGASADIGGADAPPRCSFAQRGAGYVPCPCRFCVRALGDPVSGRGDVVLRPPDPIPFPSPPSPTDAGSTRLDSTRFDSTTFNPSTEAPSSLGASMSIPDAEAEGVGGAVEYGLDVMQDGEGGRTYS
ncbi:hypothetical protein B0H14DRAFT_3872438 [Mycena olivaceomarginata]|nr:hypothetical protein B0H14DRAFT_3872438 [Mycena olivaceomarginata]